MSASRLIYDRCAVSESAKASMRPMNYMLYPGKFVRNEPCRIRSGVVGGNNVSLYNGNLVDLESNLRGQTRQASYCSKLKYQPSCMFPGSDPNTGLPCPDSKTNLTPLPSCDIIPSKKSVSPDKSIFNFANFF